MPTDDLCLTTTPSIFGWDDRVRHCVHKRPSEPQSVVGGVLLDSEMSAGLRDREFSVANQDLCDIASVSWLIFERNPLTVRRRVTSAVVNSLYRSAARCRSHVGDKLVKRRTPCFADCDAFCSIVFEADVCRVLASPDHASPDCMCALVAQLGACVVSRNQLFCAQAPTTQRLAKAKPSSRSDNLCAAVAKACPRSRSSPIFGSIDNCESAKALAFQINSGSWHGSR